MLLRVHRPKLRNSTTQIVIDLITSNIAPSRHMSPLTMDRESNQIKVFASDLDGTLLPLADNAENQRDLTFVENFLWESGIQLIFVTGRPLASVCQAIESKDLPQPSTIIANVGTQIFSYDRREFILMHDYSRELDSIAPAIAFDQVKIETAGDTRLVLQEGEKQGKHKLSFYCRKCQTSTLAKQWTDRLSEIGLPIGIVASEDHLLDRGFIDFLPIKVDKNFALRWWCEYQQIQPEQVLYAGDSGNDLAAMQSGMLTIVVGNAPDLLRKELTHFHSQRFGDNSRIYLAQGHATSGVLEGLIHFCNSYEL